MSPAKQRRWVCPRCGDGCLAPSKPRRDDVRRYCLPCSKTTGRLVERTCPALDRERTAATEKRTAARAAKTQRQRATATAQVSAAGMDLTVLARKLWATPSAREASRRRRSAYHALPTLTIRRRGDRGGRGPATFSPGRYHADEHRITMTIGGDPYGAWETMAHEIAHAALGKVPGEGWHGRRFWNLLRAIVTECWPEADWRFVDAPERGYLLDLWIGAVLRDHATKEGSA